MPDGALVWTQTPTDPSVPTSAATVLDVRYPLGSRVVVASPPFQPDKARLLSGDLVAAGGPVISPDGQTVFFTGKERTQDDWQIYEVRLSAGRLRAVTSMKGGAMDPALLPGGGLVFSSPVPKADAKESMENLPALYRQDLNGTPQRLTFGSTAAVDPTTLRDGRILFVSTRSTAAGTSTPSQALFTMNNDGTEFTAFALDHDGAPRVRRPRELGDGRLGFLAWTTDQKREEAWGESVSMARPFHSRARLLNVPLSGWASIEPAAGGEWLISLAAPVETGRTGTGSLAIYRVSSKAQALGPPLLNDPLWNDLEAVSVVPREPPMGHLSAMKPDKTTGIILCLDANFTLSADDNEDSDTQATHVRVLAAAEEGAVHVLGVIPLHEDGSFMAEVPADTPLGFEALDPNKRVLRRLAPGLWVRPGENRSCLGCHEPYNRSPGNQRPMATFYPPAALVHPASSTETLTSQATSSSNQKPESTHGRDAIPEVQETTVIRPEGASLAP